MFVIVFRPGPLSEVPVEININSFGHGPLLFFCRESKTREPFWAEHFVHAEVFTQYFFAEQFMLDKEKLSILALRKIYEVVKDMQPRPKIEGIIAIVPLMFGPAVQFEHVEAI